MAELEEQDSWQAVLKEEPDKDTKVCFLETVNVCLCVLCDSVCACV